MSSFEHAKWLASPAGKAAIRAQFSRRRAHAMSTPVQIKDGATKEAIKRACVRLMCIGTRIEDIEIIVHVDDIDDDSRALFAASLKNARVTTQGAKAGEVRVNVLNLEMYENKDYEVTT